MILNSNVVLEKMAQQNIKKKGMRKHRKASLKLETFITEKIVKENQSIYIPLGAMHRMENPGKVPLTLIEVQTGSYFGEDDIVRYEDVYSRGQGIKG